MKRGGESKSARLAGAAHPPPLARPRLLPQGAPGGVAQRAKDAASAAADKAGQYVQARLAAVQLPGPVPGMHAAQHLLASARTWSGPQPRPATLPSASLLLLPPALLSQTAKDMLGVGEGPRESK